MNNLPLQPLAWFELESTHRLICEVVTPICEYSVWRDSNSVVYSVLYYNRHTEAPTKEATGFATIDEAKQWAWNHYNEEMQPYVKPMPTWIDVSERLPKEDGLYLAYYPDELHEWRIVFFSSNINKFNLFHDLITHWMPLPEPPISKESDCDY